MKRFIQWVLLAVPLMFAGAVFARTPAPAGAAVYFIAPVNGDVVSSPVTVKFGLKGIGVAPAGVDNPKTGHHHLLITCRSCRPLKNLGLDASIPANANYKHFVGHGGCEIALRSLGELKC